MNNNPLFISPHERVLLTHRLFILAPYDTNTLRYHQGVYKHKRADLIAVFDSTLSPLFLGQTKNLHKLSLTSFKQEMLEGLRGEGVQLC